MEQVVAGLLPLARVAVVLAFVALALVALLRVRAADRSGRWVAVAFATIAIALLLGWWPDLADVELPGWVAQVVLLLMLAFPYLLLRFTASFVALPRWLEVSAGVAALAVVAILVPTTTAITEPPPLHHLIIALAYWVLVSLVTVGRLWHAGRAQPTVTRRRMRLMSVGTAVLAVALLLAGRLADRSPLAALTVNVFALCSAFAFGLGFSPPRMLRRAWRLPEEEQLMEATVAVLRAHTVDEVSRALLPPTVRIVNGAGAALVDRQGEVLGAVGDAPTVGTTERAGASGPTPRDLRVPLGPDRGELVVRTGPYSPFFGSEDRGLLRSMAAVADLALERCELLAEERAQRAALQDAQRAAEHARAEADRANTAKSEFLSRMSHELRTPLNAILGFGQLLGTASLTEEDRQGVGHIVKAGHHLLALINDVLDLSRIEAGMLAISLEPVHVGELISDTLALMHPLSTSRQISIRYDAAGCDLYVLTDRQRGRQVLLNLLSNAVKYNHDGGWVEVSCSPLPSGARISVVDSGPGIDPIRHEQLFVPFERLGAESSGIEGTGLGLALSRQLVERLGGSIGVESARGLGSTFWIDLPRAERPPEHDLEPAAQTSAADGACSLLLVEDNLANLRVVEAMLRRRPGVSVIPAMTGGLALDLAYEHQPDVIVLDLHLPDLTGQEVLHRLTSDPRTCHIPVIIASADATPSSVRHLLEVGAYAYITKPLDLQEFLDVVDSSLDRAPQPRGA